MQHRMPLCRPQMSGLAWAPTRGWQPVGVSTGEARLLPRVRLIDAAARHRRRPLLRVAREPREANEIPEPFAG